MTREVSDALSAPGPAELRGELERLHEKYLTMMRLRLASDADVARGVPHEPSRDELRALSRAFPGVLAELDRVAFKLLEERRDSLAALLEKTDPIDVVTLPTWVRGLFGYHRGLRGALAIKLWIAMETRRSAFAQAVPTEDELAAAIPTLAEAELARAWIGWFPRLLSPPNRRVVDLVLARVGDELGIAPEALRALLMPRPRDMVPHPVM